MFRKPKSHYPKKALPLDTPFRIVGFGQKQYLLNCATQGLEPMALYMKETPEADWNLVCRTNCNDPECLVKNQAKYRFIFKWNDALPHHPIHKKDEKPPNLIAV